MYKIYMRVQTIVFIFHCTKKHKNYRRLYGTEATFAVDSYFNWLLMKKTHNGNMAKCFYHVLLKQARLGLVCCGFLKTVTTETEYIASNTQGVFELP
jgi:hypothetical protein